MFKLIYYTAQLCHSLYNLLNHWSAKIWSMHTRAINYRIAQFQLSTTLVFKYRRGYKKFLYADWNFADFVTKQIMRSVLGNFKINEIIMSRKRER